MLWEQFDPNSINTLFVSEEKWDNVPINDLSGFLGTIWGVIKKEKDINLPAEKLLLSEFRCNSIKDEAIDLVRSKIDGL